MIRKLARKNQPVLFHSACSKVPIINITVTHRSCTSRSDSSLNMATQSTFEGSLPLLDDSHLAAWDLPELPTSVRACAGRVARGDALLPRLAEDMSEFG